MTSHEPPDYLCPFCDWLRGNETEYKQNGDIVYQDNDVTAFIAPKWWVNNPGHVIVIPNYHYENLYSITDEALSQVYTVVKKIGIAMRNAYDCTGISTRQHNETKGNLKLIRQSSVI
ncbi:MAG TPA: HIT family protein [Candidatus Saccharimonadales bacterium]|nr:HIT family protein [Candidatus Saccharimonadales bacterium]